MEHNQSLVNFGIIDKTEEEKINLDYQTFLKAFEERTRDTIESIKSDSLTLMKLYQLSEDLQTMIALQKLKSPSELLSFKHMPTSNDSAVDNYETYSAFIPLAGLKRGEVVAFGASTSFMKSDVREAIKQRINNITDSRSNHVLFYIDSIAGSSCDYTAVRTMQSEDDLTLMEHQLIANEKILRKHPNRKDLFLQNQDLRKKIKELKRKKK
jgi:hypothetical protein